MPGAAAPGTYTVRDILPGGGSTVGRDGYQECKLQKTTGRHPKWYCRYAVDVITGPGMTERAERRKYFGLCSEVRERDAKRDRDEFQRQVNAPRQHKLESQVRMDAWLTDYETTFIPSLKPNSQRVYGQALTAIRQRFGGLRLCDVSRETVQGWFNELSKTCGRARMNVLKSVLKSVFEVACDYGRYEQRNPVDRVRLPEGKISSVDRRALTAEEIRRLLSVCDAVEIGNSNLGEIVRVGLFCGPRIGEILGLTWGDIRGATLHVQRNKAQYSDDVTAPKSRSGRRILPLGAVSLKRPADVKDGDRIFPLEYRQVYRALRAAFSVAGIPMSGTACHALRRTYATYMDAAGVQSLKDLLGHSSDAMSARYVRRSFADQERAAQLMAELVIGDGLKQ